MPQYLVANYLPDDFDPSAVTEAMIEARESSPAASPRPTARGRCDGSPMAKCSSPTDRTSRPRNTWADFGYWNAPIWTRHSRGRARAPSPAMRWARCARFSSSRTRNKNPAEATKHPGNGIRCSTVALTRPLTFIVGAGLEAKPMQGWLIPFLIVIYHSTLFSTVRNRTTDAGAFGQPANRGCGLAFA